MSQETPVQPKLSDLLARFLNRQAEAQAAGLAVFDPSAEVTPYEAGPVQPIDAKLAWDEAIAVAGFYRAGVETKAWQAPPHWPTLVASHEPAVALAFCMGNFPQLVRNFHLILQKADLADLKPSVGREVQAPALADWAKQAATKKQVPQMLLALGALRLAKQFDQANAYLEANDAAIPQEWRNAWDNERAAILWHAGRCEEARALWNKLEASVPVLFNRAMAELFLGDRAKARKLLAEVIGQLPEASAWRHLAGLYLTLGQR